MTSPAVVAVVALGSGSNVSLTISLRPFSSSRYVPPIPYSRDTTATPPRRQLKDVRGCNRDIFDLFVAVLSFLPPLFCPLCSNVAHATMCYSSELPPLPLPSPFTPAERRMMSRAKKHSIMPPQWGERQSKACRIHPFDRERRGETTLCPIFFAQISRGARRKIHLGLCRRRSEVFFYWSPRHEPLDHLLCLIRPTIRHGGGGGKQKSLAPAQPILASNQERCSFSRQISNLIPPSPFLLLSLLLLSP